jgi:hemoglobin
MSSHQRDINRPEDIKMLVDSFYSKAMHDELIGHFFTEVIHLDLAEHMPIMYKFWNSVVFMDGSYQGNPMTKHIELNKKSKMEASHFQRWIDMWDATVDELFNGTNADLVKFRARSIKDLMHYKVRDSEKS